PAGQRLRGEPYADRHLTRPVPGVGPAGGPGPTSRPALLWRKLSTLTTTRCLMPAPIRFRLNGRPTSLDTDEGRTLLWVLRTDLGLTGAKYGCGAGACGACTVLLDGKAVRSCLTPLGAVRDREVTTIEGLAQNGTLHPLQEAFLEHGGFQCGYCTSGMILSA